MFFEILGHKPEILSEVVIISPENKRLKFLENHLKIAKLNCEGDVIAQTLLEETEKVFREDNKKNDSQPYSTIKKGTEEPHEIICKYFLNGTCRFGDKCFHSHGQQTNNSDLQPLDPTDENVDDSLHSKVGRKEKNCKTSFPKKPQKKTPMKTATDVINRIQWDEKLNPENFTVGYLDRFLGVIEKPYSSFNWEDITSMDQTVLTIPRHRIQYFKYCDEVVWDKTKRLDCVFGSTGPGLTILDIMETTKQQDGNLEEVG